MKECVPLSRSNVPRIMLYDDDDVCGLALFVQFSDLFDQRPGVLAISALNGLGCPFSISLLGLLPRLDD
jgi:hypothetical protein